MYFIVKTHSVLCLLLSNDKFYIHFGGSLEYRKLNMNMWNTEIPHTLLTVALPTYNSYKMPHKKVASSSSNILHSCAIC
jgi:hypothetical protein